MCHAPCVCVCAQLSLLTLPLSQTLQAINLSLENFGDDPEMLDAWLLEGVSNGFLAVGNGWKRLKQRLEAVVELFACNVKMFALSGCGRPCRRVDLSPGCDVLLFGGWWLAVTLQLVHLRCLTRLDFTEMDFTGDTVLEVLHDKEVGASGVACRWVLEGLTQQQQQQAHTRGTGRSGLCNSDNSRHDWLV